MLKRAFELGAIRRGGLAVFAWVCCAQSVVAVTNVWVGGGGTTNWSASANWTNSVVPVGASDLVVQLAGNVNLGTSSSPLNQDLADPLVLNSLATVDYPSGDLSVYLAGGALQFSANGDVQPFLFHNRENSLYLRTPVVLPTGVTLTVSNRTFGVNIEGSVSGNGALSFMSGSAGGEMTLANPTNTYTGGTYYNTRAFGTSVSYTRLYASVSNAFGTGPVVVNGGNLTPVGSGNQQAGGLTFLGVTVQTNDFYLLCTSPLFAGVGVTNATVSAANVLLSGQVNLGTNALYLRGQGNTAGTISGPIAGTGTAALVKMDLGAWTLTGANTFTGSVTVANGTLTLGAQGALVSSVPVAVSGGIFDLGGFAVTSSAVTVSGGTFSNGTLVTSAFAGTDAGTVPVPLTGSMGLTKSGSGTLVLSGANTYTGATTVNGGILQFAKRTALYGGDTAQWTDANIIVNNGATLAFNVGGDGEFMSGDVDLLSGLGSAAGGFKNGSLLGLDTTHAPGGAFDRTSVIGNPGGNMLGLHKLGLGTLTLGDANTYTGMTRIAQGVLSVSSITNGGIASGIGMSGPSRDNLVFAGGALRYTGPSTRTDRGFKYAVSTNSFIFDVAQSNAILTFGTIEKATFDGNNTTIVKTGPGTLVFGKGTGAVYNFPINALYILEGRFLTESGNTIQQNLHCKASQGPALLLGDGAEMGFNNPVENYNSGDEMLIQYIGTQTCARISAGSWLLCGPTTNSVGDRLYNTHIFDVNDGADAVDLDLRGALSLYPGLANSYVRKTGAGTMRMNSGSSSYRGTTIVRSGRLLSTVSVPKGGNSVLGNCTDNVVIGDVGTLPTDVPTFAFEGPADSSFTFARGIVACATGGAVSVIGCISNANCTFSGPITITNTLALLSVTSGTNALFITGGIAGPGGVTMVQTGTVFFAAANTYTGTTTVAAGTLRLGASERIADASPLRLTGGVLALAGCSETMGPLVVGGDAVIDFGAGGSLTLADSAAQVWAGKLVLRNWRRGADHLYVGTSASLSKAQLAAITSPTRQSAAQMADGEVVLLPLGTVFLLE